MKTSLCLNTEVCFLIYQVDSTKLHIRTPISLCSSEILSWPRSHFLNNFSQSSAYQSNASYPQYPPSVLLGWTMFIEPLATSQMSNELTTLNQNHIWFHLIPAAALLASWSPSPFNHIIDHQSRIPHLWMLHVSTFIMVFFQNICNFKLTCQLMLFNFQS